MRRRAALVLLAALALASTANAALFYRAPLGAYKGPHPAPGAITAFDTTAYRPRSETKAGAPAFLVPGSTNAALHKVGTLALDPGADSVVILVYGDNRPGFRLMTANWGVPEVPKIGSPNFRAFLWGALNIPVAVAQLAVPHLDLPRDLWSTLVSHRFTGGGEKRVLKALDHELQSNAHVSFVIQTGDCVENGLRGKLWEDFAKNYASLRRRVPYLSAVGNHERTYSDLGRRNWDAVMGPPAEPGRYWFAVDFPESIARIVFLDTNVLADPREHYPDSLENVLSRDQIAWLDSSLSVPARYRFVVMHHPLVTSGHYLDDWKTDDSKPQEVRRRARILEICRRRHVTAVIAGHEHLYQRTYVRGRDGTGFWHIATGGAGAPLYKISEPERQAALDVSLPDSSKVSWNKARSMYHYMRLTIVRHPKPGEEHIVLDVYQVGNRGGSSLVDHVDLSKLPTP